MSKLVRSEVGSNSNLVKAVQDDKEDSKNLSNAINDFIVESKNETGNGKVLDAEIWNNVRNRFEQCLVANNNRTENSTHLTNAIEEANKALQSYIGKAPIPQDPDTDKIEGYQKLSKIHYDLYIYFSTHKTKVIGSWTDADGMEYLIYDFDQDAINFHDYKYNLYKSQYEWLENLVPTDNLVTNNVYSVDLSKMTVEAF